MAVGRKWNEEAILKAIELYIRMPFGRIHSKNPDVLELANVLNRTPGSVALKMTNLASIDETLDRKGMANSSALDKECWSKFFNTLFESAKNIPSGNLTRPENSFTEKEHSPFDFDVAGGKNIPRVVNTRQGQNLFREMILASYDNKCAVSGISQQSLLIAGHIRPWATDIENRMNPRNGICLNRLHDRAFEKHLIAFEDDGLIIYSKRMDANTVEKMKRLSSNGYFVSPKKFKPDPDFVRSHREQFLE